MNLRQIVRNQKLSNFDLISLISESQKYNDFLDKAPTISKPGKEGTNQGSTNVQIRTALGYKSNNFKNRAGETDTAQQKAYNDALSYLMGAVETGELTKKDIPSEVSKIMPPAVGDRYKDKGQDTAADDEETSRPAQKKKELEPKPKKKGSKKEKEKEEEKETEELSEKDKKEIKEIHDSLPKAVREADPSIARALHYGYKRVPPGSTNPIWVPAPGNASSLYNETVSMIGAELLKENPGMKKEELRQALEDMLGKTAAWKGVKDSHIDTTIDAAITKHNMIREAMEAADIDPDSAETKSYYGTAVSLQNQYDDIVDHEGPFYGGNGQEIESIPTDTETKMFLEDFKDPDTGEKLSEQDIDNMLDNPNDPEVIKRFLALSAYNGGGGGNPSDTATIITDGDKMQFIAFSDKTSLGDQQANSTPNQLINNFYGTMRILEGDGFDFDPDEEKKMSDGEVRSPNGIIKEQGQKFKDAEKKLGKAQSAPFNVLGRLLSDPNNKEAKEIFDKVYDPPDGRRYEDIKKLHDTLNKDPDSLTDPKKVGTGVGKKLEAMKEAGIDPLPTWGYYLEQVGWKEGQPITPELTEAAYIARAGDSREFELLDPKTDILEPTSVGDALTPGQQQRYIGEAIKGLRESAEEGKIKLDSDDRKAVVNQQREIARYREESVNALNEMHDQLNEFTVKKDGEESGMGDTLMAMDMVRALHLGMIDDNAPGLFSSASVHIVAGKHRTSPEAMRECLGGVDNTDDLVRNTKTRPVEKSGPQLKSGLYESELSRSTKEKVTNDTGRYLYIVDGEYKWALPDSNAAALASDGPLGPITGRKVFAYILDAEGKEIPVGEMSMRTKGGTTLQTTYTFSNDLKKCLESKSAPANESFNALLGSILAEDKQNSLAHHWKIAEDDYPLHYFIRELNESSLK